MRLDGRRESGNIRDRRGVSGKTVGIGGGIGAVILVAVVTLLSGGNLGDVVHNVMSTQGVQTARTSTADREPDAEEQRLFDLASKVLAGTEDVWSREFQRQGWGEYREPEMVIYSGSVQTPCGQGNAQVGPFYCSADQTIYLDLDFFRNMRQDIGAGGDFAYAYVIAHEVGHHVQYLRGTLDKAHSAMSRVPEKEANKISVRLELEADYYAGIWAHNDNEMFSSIEPGDVENAVEAASKIGDDYLQKKAYGHEIPDAFNHGRSSQRVKWLTLGVRSGDPDAYSTWSLPYDQL